MQRLTAGKGEQPLDKRLGALCGLSRRCDQALLTLASKTSALQHVEGANDRRKQTAIPCVLETAMSSDVTGFVSCVVERDVMSDTGQVVLMEKGTQVVGEYRGNVRRGSKRMFVLWNRAKTPTGVIVNLASPATDALGRSGFDGEIDNHFWDRFGGALLLSIVSDGSQIAGRQLSNADIEICSTQGAGNSAAAIATEQSINIPPTLTKNQGELVSIFVARDLDFSTVYDLRLVDSRTQVLDRTVRRVTKP